MNYYDLLEIPQNADNATIEQAIKKTRRVWNNRANSPDASIRAEAEMHVREIAEAEKILLDESNRKEYDDQLSHNTKGGVENESSSSAADWEERFFKAYNREMYDFATEIAYGAVQTNERDGRAWHLYGEALRRGEKLDQAIEAFKRASILSDDPDIYRQLGFAYDEKGQWGEAYKAFMSAVRLAPNNCEYHTYAAHFLRVMDMIPEALKEVKIAYSINPDDEDTRFEYFATLFADALNAISYNRSSGKHIITSKLQLDYVNDILKTMSVVLPKNNPKCTEGMEYIVKIVVDAESTKGGGFLRSGKPGYIYNYEISNDVTRSTGLH